MVIYSFRNGLKNTGETQYYGSIFPMGKKNELTRVNRRPVYSVMLGTKTFIVLSSDTAVKDLLDKRSNIYSSRPDMFIGSTLASGGLRVLLMVNIDPQCIYNN